jgi:hypothetical protein
MHFSITWSRRQFATSPSVASNYRTRNLRCSRRALASGINVDRNWSRVARS